MKIFNFLLILIVGILCVFGYINCTNDSTDQSRQPLKEQFENSLRYVWQQKDVFGGNLIADMENGSGWSVEGIGEISFTSERSHDGSRSLRFRTYLRDEEHIKRLTEELGNSQGRNGGTSRAVLTFSQPQDWTGYNRIALWIYLHPSDIRVHSLSVSFDCDEAPSSFTDPRANSVIQHLIPGQWNYVIWEIANLQRDKVSKFAIIQGLRGHDPEEEGTVTYDIDQIELQKVDAEKYEGWEVAKGKIAFNHVGYRPGRQKTAIASGLSATEFRLINALSGEEVLKKSVEPVQNDLGQFQVLDFSEVNTPGKYFLQAGDLKTRPFTISDTLWRQPILKAMNFYYCERCGFDVPGIHPVCHKDWQGTHNNEVKIINGGWHDAGDLSQSSYRTTTAIYSMMEIINQLNLRNMDPALKELILDEALWGLDWLLKTRFGNGYRINWSTMRMYTDGVVGTIDDVVTPAGNIPWENFLASGTEASAYQILKDLNPDLANKCLKAAEEDWDAAMQLQSEWETLDEPGFYTHPRNGNTYLTVSWGIISSIQLYKTTGKDIYSEHAIEYGRLLMRLQERLFPEGIPVTGFFYTGLKKLQICNYSHAAFEESALLALKGLCEAFPDHDDWIEWYGTITLHSEYFLKRGAEYTVPYYMLPAAVYRKSDIMRIEDPETRTEMLKQFLEGKRFTDEYYLRCFPIWTNSGFHGNTGVQLSETAALAAAVQIRNDLAGEDLAGSQLQWVFGGNPFSQSLMYGEGYDYAPLYGPNPGDIVGALPVGMDCMHNDEPYWDDCNIWTYKEIWVLPVNRFLLNMAYFGMPGFVEGKTEGKALKSISFTEQKTMIKKPVTVGIDGTFRAVLPAGEYLIECGDTRKTLTIVSGGNYNILLNPLHSVNLSGIVKDQKSGDNNVKVEVTAEGKGVHDLSIRIFNGNVTEFRKTIDLGEGTKIKTEWDVQIKDQKAPWVFVIIPDDDLSCKKELTGTLERD